MLNYLEFLLTAIGVSTRLPAYVSQNYRFRRNPLHGILNTDEFEYCREGNRVWNSISRFIECEKSNPHHFDTKPSLSRLNAYPNWLIRKVVINQTRTAENYCQKADYLKIVDIEPIRVRRVKPVKTSIRKPIVLEKGDSCYVCFGLKKRRMRKLFVALPAIVESSSQVGDEAFYNIMVLKVEKKKVTYFGRHMVRKTELGHTPQQAVVNMAYSQAIY